MLDTQGIIFRLRAGAVNLSTAQSFKTESDNHPALK